jgi:putative lipoprotein
MALGGKPVLKGIGDTKAYLILHDSDKRIAGSTGCNRLVGGYELSGDSLHFTPAGMTMMACSPPLMKQEQAFSAALGSVTSYRINGQQLELLLGDTVKARFQAKYLK